MAAPAGHPIFHLNITESHQEAFKLSEDLLVSNNSRETRIAFDPLLPFFFISVRVNINPASEMESLTALQALIMR